MKKVSKIFGVIAFTVIMVSVLIGCSMFREVTIRSSDGRESVIAGQSIRLTASGREIKWSVSTTPDGSGLVAPGTFILNGVLTVSINETARELFVIAISDKDSNSDIMRIRVVSVSGVTVAPASGEVVLGRTSQFSAVVAGEGNPDQLVTWKVTTDAGGLTPASSGTSISAQGLLTVSMTEPARTLYVTATSVIDPTKSGSSTVTVLVPTVTSITISPANPSIRPDTTLTFTASVIGELNPPEDVTWSVSASPSGLGAVTGTNISPNGVLTTTRDEILATVYVIATSVYDNTKSASVPVNIIIPQVTNVVLTPNYQSIPVGGSLQLNVVVTGTNDPPLTVSWKITTDAAGFIPITSSTSITAGGLLTIGADETAPLIFITATSTYDPSKNDDVIVLIPR